MAQAAWWEPWAFLVGAAAFCGDIWVFYEASHTHTTVWKVALGVLSALVAIEGTSVALNYRDAAYKIAGPDPRKWVTMRNSPWPSSPPMNRAWGLFLVVGAIVFAARGIAA